MFKSNTLGIVAMQIRKYFNASKRDVHYYESINQVDVMDEFTTQLLQKKTNKWETIRSNKNIKSGKIQNLLIKRTFDENKCVNINGFKSDDIDDLIIETLDTNNSNKLTTIINQCTDCKTPPSFQVIEKVLSFCARNGLRSLMSSALTLLKDWYPEQMELNSNFEHYIAEVIWLRGNITDSLVLFEQVYRSNQYLRRRIRLMIKYLITNITSQRSEAALLTVISFAERLVREYDDNYLLGCAWQSCFLSDWYTDQCLAVQILEKHEQLIDVIVARIPHIVRFALRENQPDTMQRLLEVLLKYDVREHYASVLRAMFSYKYQRKDLRSCAEILQWSLKLKVPLLSSQHEQFLILLLGLQHCKNEQSSKIPGTPNYQLKF